jgi:hypothetical protein
MNNVQKCESYIMDTATQSDPNNKIYVIVTT